MNRSKFENLAISYLENQDQLIDNHNPYDEIKDNYNYLKVIGEVD